MKPLKINKKTGLVAWTTTCRKRRWDKFYGLIIYYIHRWRTRKHARAVKQWLIKEGMWGDLEMFWSAPTGDVKGKFGKTNAERLRPWRGF